MEYIEMLKHFFRFLLVFFISLPAIANQPLPESCAKWPWVMKYACQRLYQTWHYGHNDLIITGYSWHNRFTYPSEKVKTYNELAYGGGLGRSFIDEKGNMHTLMAFGFSDSHKNLEPVAGYGFLKNWPVFDMATIGIGFTGLVTIRRDLNKGNPFPGALPLLGMAYKRLTLIATYIPGQSNLRGNVLFIFGKWQLTGV